MMPDGHPIAGKLEATPPGEGRAGGELSRFLAVATLQAVANYGTYVAVLQIADWPIAFVSAVIVGLALQTILQFKATFRRPITAGASMGYVAYQLAYLAVFFLMLKLVIGHGVAPIVAPLVVIAVVTGPNFLLTRWLIKRRAA